MTVYIPTIKKLFLATDIYIERIMPLSGEVSVNPGDKVEPSSNLGSCKISYEIVNLGSNFKPVRKDISGYYDQGSLVGKLLGKKFVAPFKGSLNEENNSFCFKSEEVPYWLLSGVWGQVQDSSHNKSVLLKTQAVNIHTPICTPIVKSGELIVFPNPQHDLVLKYMDNYVKSSSGKIFYVGDKITLDITKKAYDLKINAILGGSADYDAYEYALKNNVGLGIFTLIGNLETPSDIYNFINELTNRYVFFYGDRGLLQIPVPWEYLKKYSLAKSPSSTAVKSTLFKYVKKGLNVQIFEYDHFGMTGVIDRAGKSGILVKLHKSDEVVSVMPPNLVAIE